VSFPAAHDAEQALTPYSRDRSITAQLAGGDSSARGAKPQSGCGGKFRSMRLGIPLFFAGCHSCRLEAFFGPGEANEASMPAAAIRASEGPLLQPGLGFLSSRHLFDVAHCYLLYRWPPVFSLPVC
jgi:hypothetical protein